MRGVEAGTRLLLIRHGETRWNFDQRVQGHQDVPLSERGREQAALLRDWLAAETPDAVFSSDLSRARETAEIVAGGRVDVVPDRRYREACFGSFEGLCGAEMRDRYPEAYAAWRADSVRHRPPGGETLEELQARCLEALAEHLGRHPGRTVAVVAHGGPVRVMVCGVLGLPLGFYGRLRVENTAVARILFGERGPMLAGFNDVAHLRASLAGARHTGWEEK